MTMHPTIGLLSALLACLVASPASATYNANIAGVPTKVVTGENGLVLFSLDTQPASHPSCNTLYFAIDNGLSAVAFNRMYARLLAAKAAGESINIGYDNAGSCVYGYMHAYQIG